MIAAAESPQLILDGWTAWLTFIGLACGTLVSFAAFWRKVLRPMLKVGAVIEESFPVWVKIAKQYSDEAGGLLTSELLALANNQREIAANQREMVGKLDDLHAYSHQMKHDIIGDVSKLGMAVGTTATVVDALIETAKELRLIREDLHRDDGHGV